MRPTAILGSDILRAGRIAVAEVSMGKLKTRNVFLDAEAFRSGSFNYRSTPFRTLAELAETGEVRVFMTDITVNEVKALIREDIEKAVRAQQAFESKAYILRNCRSRLDRDRLKALDAKKVEKELLQQLGRFLKEAKVRVLSTKHVKVNEVFDWYFEMKAPFGPGAKKHEFPDAFASAAVRTWCAKEKQEIYIVSADADMQKLCGDGVVHGIEKLSGFLNLVASHDENLVAFVKDQIPGIEKSVIEQVKEQFEGLGFVLQDHDGDVDNVAVLDVRLSEIDVIHATDDEAILETEAEVTFEADLNYGDEGSASYDSEDKTVFYLDYVNETVTRTKYISVEINVFYKGTDPDSFEINDVSIEHRTILVRTSSDEGWPYK